MSLIRVLGERSVSGSSFCFRLGMKYMSRGSYVVGFAISPTLYIMTLTPGVYRIKDNATGFYLAFEDSATVSRGISSLDYDHTQKVRDTPPYSRC